MTREDEAKNAARRDKTTLECMYDKLKSLLFYVSSLYVNGNISYDLRNFSRTNLMMQLL
jgi:hypothetical protein